MCLFVEGALFLSKGSLLGPKLSLGLFVLALVFFHKSFKLLLFLLKCNLLANSFCLGR